MLGLNSPGDNLGPRNKLRCRSGSDGDSPSDGTIILHRKILEGISAPTGSKHCALHASPSQRGFKKKKTRFKFSPQVGV